MEKAVVISNANKGITVKETIDAIYNSGFRNVFIQWYNKDLDFSQEEQLKYARNLGLNVIFVHLGYKGINSIWEEGKDGDLLVERYKKDIQICKENAIDMVVMHLTSKSIAPKYNEKGLLRIKKIADFAKSLGVKIAFENTKIKGYLEYVIENVRNKNVGICYDSGHCHAHFNDEFDYSKFKNRIFAVHLHDNDKSDDLHLVPFDGTIDWKMVINELKKANYNGPITLELCYRNEYMNLNINDFYQKGYKVAEKLEKIFFNK